LDGWRVVDCFASPLERQQLEHVTYFSGKVLLYQKIQLENDLKIQEKLPWKYVYEIDTPTGDNRKRERKLNALHIYSSLNCKNYILFVSKLNE
jgi:hypothetical protein